MTVAGRVAALGCVGALLAVPGASGRPSRPPQPKPIHTTALGAHESEYRIRLTRQWLRHGRMVLELRNLGQDPHNLVVAPLGGPGPTFAFPVGTPGSRQTRALNLSRGVWVLYCSLPGHEQLGMRATLTVR